MTYTSVYQNPPLRKHSIVPSTYSTQYLFAKTMIIYSVDIRLRKERPRFDNMFSRRKLTESYNAQARTSKEIWLSDSSTRRWRGCASSCRSAILQTGCEVCRSSAISHAVRFGSVKVVSNAEMQKCRDAWDTGAPELKNFGVLLRDEAGKAANAKAKCIERMTDKCAQITGNEMWLKTGLRLTTKLRVWLGMSINSQALH